ncbi:MAG: oligosaccharide flippase family protein [Flavobacteriales bacterium]
MGKTVFYNSFITLLRQAFSLLFGLLAVVLIARVLGSDSQGQYTLTILLPTILYTLFNSGISISTVYFIGQNKYSDKIIYSTNIISGLILSLISFFVGVVLILFFKDYFFENTTTVLLLYSLVLIPILFLQRTIQSFFHAKENYEQLNVVALLNQLGLLLFSILFVWYLDLGVAGAVLSFSLSQFLMLVVSCLIMHFRYDLFLPKLFSINYLKESLFFGLKGHFSNVLTFISYRIDILLIAYFIDDMAVGIYSISVLLVERIWLISQSVSSVLFARVSNLTTEIQKTNFTILSSRNTLFLTTIFGLIISLISPWLIITLFGIEYQPSIKPFLYMLPGVVLFSLSKILSNDFVGRGKPQINSYIGLIVALLNVLLNIVLIPKYGVIGAAISTSFCYGIDALIKVIYFSSLYKISLLKFVLVNKADINLYKTNFIFLLNAFKK